MHARVVVARPEESPERFPRSHSWEERDTPSTVGLNKARGGEEKNTNAAWSKAASLLRRVSLPWVCVHTAETFEPEERKMNTKLITPQAHGATVVSALPLVTSPPGVGAARRDEHT